MLQPVKCLPLLNTCRNPVWRILRVILLQVLEACVAEGLLGRAGSRSTSPEASPLREGTPGAEGAPLGGRGKLGWGGAAFWAALGSNLELEAEVRGLLGAAKAALRRRGALPLQARNCYLFHCCVPS